MSCLRADRKLMNHAIESIMMAVGNGAAPTSRSWAVKIVYIAWAIFCVIMLAAYTVSMHDMRHNASQCLSFGVTAGFCGFKHGVF
jgi:hypothetical protein